MDAKFEKSKKMVDYLNKDIPLPKDFPKVDKDDILDLLLYYIEKQDELIFNLKEHV